jgi:hypothetical protein
MTEPVGRERAVRFLLGELPDDERDKLEERFFVEDDALAELKEAEDDLVDAYSRGLLSAEQRALFEARHLQGESGERRVEFARALHAAARGRKAATSPARRSRVWPWAASIAALALTGALLGLARARSTLARLEAERVALAQAAQEMDVRARGLADEVERLRTRVADLEGLGRGLDRVVALTLTPGLARELQPLASVAIPADASRVELTLRLKDDPYPRYGVAIETADGRRIWSGASSASDAGGGGRALLVSVPAPAVQPGHYVVTVEGIRPGRPAVPHADYVFRALPPPTTHR